jgi:CheY-like chemotaxis protein
MKALIADDDVITLLLLSSALSKLGHEVCEATNGREAWDAWSSGEFPLIVSDWMMPDLGGLEFCRRIRAEPRADYTNVVLLTSLSGIVGDPRVGNQEWAQREGMVAFAGYPLLVKGRVVGVMAMFARHPRKARPLARARRQWARGRGRRSARTFRPDLYGRADAGNGRL